jgi:hypothetical protein
MKEDGEFLSGENYSAMKRMSELVRKRPIIHFVLTVLMYFRGAF